MRPRTHLCLHEVDPLGPELTYTVEDVHDSFVFSHVKHSVDGDEAASPPSSSTGRQGVALERPLPRSSVPELPQQQAVDC